MIKFISEEIFKMAKKAKSSKKSSKSKGGEMLVIASKAKAALKKAGCNTASGALEALSQVVHDQIQQAAARAKANGRKTVRDYDFNI